MNRDKLLAAVQAAELLEKKRKYRKIDTYFTDTGPNARTNFPKQLELMAAGKDHNLRALIGGNGTGKSIWLGSETYYHMSGQYPSWWTGHRFTYPINAWLFSKDAKILREGLQEVMFGGIGDEDIGSGLIPRDDLLDEKGKLSTWAMAGTANCIGGFLVKHYTNGLFDGYSKCEFKTYEAGWAACQGPTRDWIGFDEDPNDPKIYAECIARLRGKDGRPPGHFAAAFTPTFGYSEMYQSFCPNGNFPLGGQHPENPNKFTQNITWDDVKHLDSEWKKSMISEWQISDPANIEARTQGLAAMGSGRVYPINESFVVVPKLQIPTYWKKAYGMDPGQANFAVVWVCEDPNTGIKYVYDEYKHGKVVYIIHAEAIKNRGEWLTGGIDPHEAVKPRDSGETVQSYFESSGLNLVAAKGDPDALRARIRAMFESGSLKIMDNCQGILNEIRTYRYDANDPNRIARGQDDHRLDALMYALCTFDQIAQSYAQFEEEQSEENSSKRNSDDSQRNPITGY